MTQYLMTHLDLPEDDANRLRRHYWHLYGATLCGLMRHHGTDPHHFLHHTHQFPQLDAMLVKAPGLRLALRQLKGRKLVFTNAPRKYAEQVLTLLGIRDLFEGVFSIESTRFSPKPTLLGFMRLIKRHRLQPRTCIMVEDSLPALLTAKRLGMRTVYINPRGCRPSYVDVRIGSVLTLPRIAASI